MPETTQIEFSEEELTAVGLALALWRAGETEGGVGLRQAVNIMIALEQADAGVMRALIDRVVLRMSVAEEEVFHKTDGLFDDDEIAEKRTRMHAHLDQVFAEFEAEGRSLFRSSL